MQDRCPVSPAETAIATLGPAKIPSPLPYCRFTDDADRVTMELDASDFGPGTGPCRADFELAGPRGKIYFDSSKVKVAIVTCGGLCPGLNDVIRAIVMECRHNYNVAGVLGIRFGLQGFIESYGHAPVDLTSEAVSDIHQFGGTVLGSSRGPQRPEDIVDSLERLNVGILFVVGGDGTMKAARRIQEEIARRRSKISVIGVPKTIDNDVNLVTKSFGFDTAVEKATEAIRCAHTEAIGALNGVGLVKVMGRESGFIAAQATLALKEVNYVLVPECSFSLTGPHGLLPSLETRLKSRKHAVIVVAEGAGQSLLPDTGARDASGNPVLGDIAQFLCGEIEDYFRERDMPLTLKFIDPSYIIRSVPANANDRVYCGFLGQNAVHAAMAGKTGMVVSRLFDRYVHLPLDLVTLKRKKLNITSDYWRSVLESTGQHEVTPFSEDPTVFCSL
ncbi:ATP-dependent 6-phosphofructokinase [Desulfovibrio aerotolerans]|uniref:ATP-dependent 6-phosphofructokinase n=1 Tax=Solidesulfovibrio aerotolerans TaxID=295255 RepID=A0A7C9IN34_9BACT|nr:ATP-dependent 6-phosphofructokinase [Solidesulfovibrio aerotolerans]MYL82879.1 ATP-dependent 6-phosphofructokinase [Solidesulfovibrio aerotolerans]